MEFTGNTKQHQGVEVHELKTGGWVDKSTKISRCDLDNGTVLINVDAIDVTFKKSTVKDTKIYDSAVIDSTIESSSMDDVTVVKSTVKSSPIEHSVIERSQVTSAEIDNATVSDSTVTDFFGSGLEIKRSMINKSEGVHFVAVFSKVKNSAFTRVELIKCTIENSELKNQELKNETIKNQK